jgi:hypothetical protein
MVHNPYQSPQESTRPESARLGCVLPRDIVLQGSLPVRDVLHTQVLILSRRWPYALLCLGMYVVFVLALGMLNPSVPMFGNTFMVLGLIIMPAILPLTLGMVYVRLLRDARREVGVFAVTKTVLSQDGIVSRINDDQVSIRWSSFSGFTCSARVVLLFLHDSNNRLIVSRSKLSNPEDWTVLLDFLHDRFPRHSAE